MTVSNKSSRDIAVDMLRVFACCAVVGLHTFAKDVTPVASALYYASSFAVPIFFMTSRAFLLNRGRVPFSYALHKIKRIFEVVVIWTAIAAVLYALLILARSGVQVALVALLTAFSATFAGTFTQVGGMLGQLWFLWALAIMYLLLPLLSRLDSRCKVAMLVVLCLAGAALQLASYVHHAPLEALVPQVLRIWIWAKYFLLGGVLYSERERFKHSRVLPIATVVASIIIAVALFLYAGMHLLGELGNISYAEYFYDSLLFVVWCSVLLSAAESIHPTSKRWVEIASLTMGVYIIHILVLAVFMHFLDMSNPLVGSGLMFVLVLTASFACVGALKPTKLFNVLFMM